MITPADILGIRIRGKELPSPTEMEQKEPIGPYFPLNYITAAFTTRQVALTAVATRILAPQSDERVYILTLSTLTITNPRAFIGRNGVTTTNGFQLPIIVPFPIIVAPDTELWGVSNATGAVVTILEL